MKDTKSWIKSKTIWGILIFLSPLLSKYVGHLIGHPINIEQGMNEIVELVGAAIAAYGRVVANTSLIAPKQ